MARISQSARNRPVTFDMDRVRHPLEIALGEAAFDGVDPNQIQQEIGAADAAFNDAQWQVAIDGYNSILERVPLLNALHMRIGNAHAAAENYEEAIAAYERAAAGDAALAQEVEIAVGRMRMAMGDFDAAGDALAAAASGGGGSREDLYNLGDAGVRQGRGGCGRRVVREGCCG